MNKQRLNRILEQLKNNNLKHMIICDPYSIFYLTGYMNNPMERLYALYINADGNNKIFLNNLFTVPEDLGVEKVWSSDTDDGVALIAQAITDASPLGIDKNWPARFLLHLMELKSGMSFVNSSNCVDSVRGIKDTAEQDLMRTSSILNDEVMKDVSKVFYEGITEKEAAEKILKLFTNHEADGVSFEPLVGFGKNAAEGHHAPDNTILQNGDCVLVDMGCIKEHYCSDMTRTFFFHEASKHSQSIYNIVKEANEAAEAMIRPGVRYCDIDKTARDVITKAGYGPQFTHRLGHSIGLEDHEFGDVSSANTNEVKPGMIFSVEPGIYIENDIGVRVEDLILVTETGCEILNSYPKELQIIG